MATKKSTPKKSTTKKPSLVKKVVDKIIKKESTTPIQSLFEKLIIEANAVGKGLTTDYFLKKGVQPSEFPKDFQDTMVGKHLIRKVGVFIYILK